MIEGIGFVVQFATRTSHIIVRRVRSEYAIFLGHRSTVFGIELASPLPALVSSTV